MTRKVLVVGLIVGLVAMLSGCDLIDQILALVGGGSPGGIPGGTGDVASVSISYSLAVTLWERPMPQYAPTSSEGSVDMDFFRPYGGTYNAATRTFTNNWDNQAGDFSNTYLEVRLNETEDAIEYFYARQTQSNVWFAWTFVNEIRGYNIPYSHTEGGSRYFVLTGTSAHLALDRMTYKGVTRESEGYSLANPNEWAYLDYVASPNIDDVIPASTNTITIRLD